MRIFGRLLPCLLLLPALHFLWVSTPFLLGFVSRPTYRALMRGRLRLRRALPTPLQRWLKSLLGGDAGAIELYLLFDQRAEWHEYLDVLGPRNEVMRSHLPHIADLFWINERFDEARQAVRLWRDLAEEQVRQNSDVASAARESLRAINGWTERNRDRIKSAGSDKSRKAEAVQAALKSDPYPRDAFRSGYFHSHPGTIIKSGFGSYRSASIACRILDICEQDGDARARQFVRELEGSRNPLLPLQVLVFDQETAAKLGISDQEFKRIQAEAEEIP